MRKWSFTATVLVFLSSLFWPFAQAQTTFLSDTFTGANGTSLSAHNPDTSRSSTWAKFSGIGDHQIQNNQFQPTTIILSSFEASAYDEGVLLEWRTGYEVNNLGFHVYREEGGQLYQVTPEPIMGTAFLTGPDRRTAGYSYTWWDRYSDQRSAVSGLSFLLALRSPLSAIIWKMLTSVGPRPCTARSPRSYPINRPPKKPSPCS